MPECYADDILTVKEMGFNTLRKHIKVEPEEFYYQCDRLGMIVFQDMVNNGPYRYLRDTVLPTVLPASQSRIDDRRMHRSGAQREMFLTAMASTVRQLGNHPCIVYWTVFNEGWGQFDADRVYERMRELDDIRWIDTTSGWFRRKKTDVDSRHVYFRPIRLRADVKKPLVLSEFGGYSYGVRDHVFNPDNVYGYGNYDSAEKLENAVCALYEKQVIPTVATGLCAAIYTQVSDVEDEINGIVTYDRKVRKLTPERMLPLAKRLQEAIAE